MSSDDISILSRLLMRQFNVLNVYTKSYIYVQSSTIPKAYYDQVFSLIDQIDQIYPTIFSDNSVKICDFNLKLTHFVIGFRGLAIWNKFPTESEVLY